MGQSTLRWGTILALAAFIVLLYTWVLLPDAWLSDSLLYWVSEEDGLIEWLGTLSLLVASGLFFACFLRARRGASTRFKKLFLLGLAVALFVGAGEELSWGQRIFDLQTPGVLKDNNQHELTLHNLPVVGQGTDDPDPGRIWSAFELFALFFMVALPLIAWRDRKTGVFLARYVPIVPLACAGLFLLTELQIALSQFAYPSQWVDPTGSVSNDIVGYAPHLWQGGGTTETALSLLWAVVALEVLRREPKPLARARGDRAGARGALVPPWASARSVRSSAHLSERERTRNRQV